MTQLPNMLFVQAEHHRGEAPAVKGTRGCWGRTWLRDRLHDRPEGFVRDGKLAPGRSYGAIVPAHRTDRY